MKKLTTEKLISYMKDRSNQKLRHEPVKLAEACNEVAEEFNHNSALDMLKLLCFNDPIPGLHTHSYSFHTASGRNIINTIQEYYYEK
jgi:hypothetical protein